MSISNIFLGGFLYNLVDDGIANVLCLETLRHGTNPVNNLRIRIQGGRPSQGGSSTGSTNNFHCDCTINYFYMFKDSEFSPHITAENPTFEKISKLIIKGIGNRFLPTVHASLSGYNLMVETCSAKMTSFKVLKIFIGIFGAVTSFIFSPTLRFRFSKIDSSRLQEDFIYNGAAYKTAQVVEPWRIGLLGSIVTGVNRKWFSRFKKNKIKFLTGITQLTLASAVTALYLIYFSHKSLLTIPTLAGALLA
ncbi:MAG: hypothetical protein Tsb0021_14920 [Chlamydiales bacterium]